MEQYLLDSFHGFIRDQKDNPMNQIQFSYLDIVIIAFVKASNLEIENTEYQSKIFETKPTPGKSYGVFINEIREQARQTKSYNNSFIPIRAHIFNFARKYFPDRIYDVSWLYKSELDFYSQMELKIGSTIIPSTTIILINPSIAEICKFCGKIYILLINHRTNVPRTFTLLGKPRRLFGINQKKKRTKTTDSST